MAARLRQHAGRPVFEPGNPAMGMILQANPHRVFISRLGRIEVYQPIPPPSGKSPDGPHTHVLPKLLKSGRTHPATEPIPRDGFPARIFIRRIRRATAWASPGRSMPRVIDSFQRMMAGFGDPENVAIKRRVRGRGRAGEPPSAIAGDRHGRTAVRIALRQMKAAGTRVAGIGRMACRLRSGRPRGWR